MFSVACHIQYRKQDVRGILLRLRWGGKHTYQQVASLLSDDIAKSAVWNTIHGNYISTDIKAIMLAKGWIAPNKRRFRFYVEFSDEEYFEWLGYLGEMTLKEWCVWKRFGNELD